MVPSKINIVILDRHFMVALYHPSSGWKCCAVQREWRKARPLDLSGQRMVAEGIKPGRCETFSLRSRNPRGQIFTGIHDRLQVNRHYRGGANSAHPFLCPTRRRPFDRSRHPTLAFHRRGNSSRKEFVAWNCLEMRYGGRSYRDFCSLCLCS
jgi:hypothetical protein